MVLLLTEGCGSESKPILELAATPFGAGSVHASWVPEGYAAEGTVTLTALPTSGWRFDHWEGPVEEPHVPVTTVTASRYASVTAFFSRAALPGEIEGIVEWDHGGLREEVSLAIPDGSAMQLAAGLRLLLLGDPLPDGPAKVTLRDRGVWELPPVSFANWVWTFDVAVELVGVEDDILFSTLSDQTVVDPQHRSSGAWFSAPLGVLGLPVGAEVSLYMLEGSSGSSTPLWRLVASSAVEADGNARFSVPRAGSYAVGRPPVRKTNVASSLETSPIYDCVIQTQTPMNRVKVLEDSTAEVFHAWLFTDIPPGEMPETTQWVVFNGPEPSMGRLENYGRRFRVRSSYANLFAAACGLQNGETISATMQGPYQVNPDGEPSSVPIVDPYAHCELIFAGDVKLVVLARAGNYASFVSDVVRPLRAVFDSGSEITSNVQVSSFKNLTEGYYAEVWVETERCTRQVADALPYLQEEGVSIALMRGRLVYIVDRRGGKPYVAVYGPVAQGTGLGVRFYDPYWELQGEILGEHSLGGRNHMMRGLVDMEYDCAHDILWVIMKDENGLFNLFRYDHPIYHFGDRPPDGRINAPSFGLRQLCVDPDGDRLFVHDFDAGANLGDVVRVYGQASTRPELCDEVTHVSFHYPNQPNPESLTVDYLAPIQNTLHLIRRYSVIDPPGAGLGLFAYTLGSVDHGARFRGWVAFGGEESTTFTRGVYSKRSNVLYVAADDGWNGSTAVYIVHRPNDWQSDWVTDPNTGHGFWLPDAPRYSLLAWPNPGGVQDLDVVEGTHEILAVCQQRETGQVEILVFHNANTSTGFQEPFCRLTLMHPARVVELINPPGPP